MYIYYFSKPWGCFVCICMCVFLFKKFYECFLSLEAVCVFVCMYMCVGWGHLDVRGELASHKRSLTHHPSSQGWASRCP